jgi:O-antigen ligase
MFLEALLFLFFFTLHADQLSLTIAGFTFRLNNALGLFLLLFFLIRLEKRLFSFDRKALLAMLAMTASLLLSFVFSPYKERCGVFLAWYALTLALYFLFPYLACFELGFSKVFRLYMLSFFCVGAYGTLQFLFSLAGIQDPFVSQPFIVGFRPNAFAYEPSYYALYLTPFIVLVNFVKVPKLFRWLAHIFFLLTTTTSAFFAYALFFILLPFFRLVSAIQLCKIYGSFALAIGGLALALPSVAQGFFLKFFYGDYMQHHSFFERWVGIKNAWTLFVQHPFMGVGIGGVPQALMEAWLTGNSRFNFIIQNRLGEDSLKVFEPTNVTVELLASVGILGLLAAIFCVYAYVKTAREAYKKSTAKKEIRLFLLSALVLFFVLQFNQGLFRTYVWTHLALTYAYFVLVWNQENVSESPLSKEIVW